MTAGPPRWSTRPVASAARATTPPYWRSPSRTRGSKVFDAHVPNTYNVTCVLDDRTQVIQAWRAIGLTALQVADGDF
ncbi:phosphatase domain-containing protein [Streptomyces endocoffeicus]|uniref:phosphatase domain-containing protein n=1 Tax=Streptomyces endocoffeicus TaxID=2898945 RepID=UPI003FD6FFA6